MSQHQSDLGRELIGDMVDMIIQDDQLPLLYEHLTRDAEARVEFVQQILLDAQLSELLGPENVVAALDADASPGAVAERQIEEKPSRSRWFAVMLSFAALAATAILIIRTRHEESGRGGSHAQVSQNIPSADRVETEASQSDSEADRRRPVSVEPAQAVLAMMLLRTLMEPRGVRGVRMLWFLPAVQAAREGARRSESRSHLKQIVLALHNFHDRQGRFPALYSTDKSGRPLLSWRVHLLPYLDHAELHARFRLNEPWDSEHNLALLNQMPTVFGSPETSKDRFVTNYLAVATDSSVMIPPSESMFGAAMPLGTAMNEVTDGTSNTLMIVEVSDDRACEWTRPVDYEVTAEHPMNGLGHKRDRTVILTAFADGSVRAISRNLSPAFFLGLTTRNGGESLESP